MLNVVMWFLTISLVSGEAILFSSVKWSGQVDEIEL